MHNLYNFSINYILFTKFHNIIHLIPFFKFLEEEKVLINICSLHVLAAGISSERELIGLVVCINEEKITEIIVIFCFHFIQEIYFLSEI
jgi:hypothetical protein